MKNKRVFFAVFGLLFASFVLPVFGVVSTSRIDRVREKGVLESADLRIIDDFVADVIAELLATVDFTSVSKTRAIILSRTNSNQDSAAAQYSQQFSESVRKHLAAGLQQAQMLQPEDLRFKVVLNLLILLDDMEDWRLVELALGQLDDKSEVVRYMAVRVVTNPNIIKKLKQSNSADARAVIVKITEKLTELVGQMSPEVLDLSVELTEELEVPQSEQLLLKITDLRIKGYADWTVKNGLLDINVLKALYRKLSLAEGNNPEFGRRFGQLYSYAMQKYIRGLKGGNFLTATKKQQLASVLVETEKVCISSFLESPQTGIKRAVDAGDYLSLQAEHDRLLGSAANVGLLPEKLRYNYGDNPNGVARVEPLILPEKPAN